MSELTWLAEAEKLLVWTRDNLELRSDAPPRTAAIADELRRSITELRLRLVRPELFEGTRHPDPEVEEVWRDFWQDLVAPLGRLDEDLVKAELFDYRIVMQEVTKVYDELTCGRISKPNTAAVHVIGEVQGIHQREIDEAVREASAP